MLRITARLSERRPVDERLLLPFEPRSRSRFRAALASGEECAVILGRGGILRDGELLITSDGRVVEVKAAPEVVSKVRSEDARLLARTAYHLGNRHVALQIGPGWLRYLHDHVLDDMVGGLVGWRIVHRTRRSSQRAGLTELTLRPSTTITNLPGKEDHDPGEGP